MSAERSPFDAQLPLAVSAEGRFSQVLLSLSAFEKRTQKTPPHELDVAERRLYAWRQRGAERRRRPKA